MNLKSHFPHAASCPSPDRPRAARLVARRARGWRVPQAALHVGAYEFGAEQYDLRRIVDPEEQYDHRAGGAVTRRHATLAEIEADHLLAECEEQGSDDRTRHHVAP